MSQMARWAGFCRRPSGTDRAGASLSAEGSVTPITVLSHPCPKCPTQLERVLGQLSPTGRKA